MPLETQKPDVSVSDGLVDVEIADGADVNAGSTTDAAVTTDSNATLSAKLRGLVKILADVWDDASNLLRVAIQNTVTIQDGGNVISIDDAGSSITVDGTLTADVAGDVGLDLRASPTVKRYMASLFGGGSTTGGTNVVGVMNPAGGTDVRIYRIRVNTQRTAAGTGTPLALYRSNNVAGGFLVTKSDIQALDTDYGDTNLECRIDAPTGTNIGRYMMVLGSDTTGDAAITGITDEWVAIDKYDMITLHPGEGLIWELAKVGDGDDDYNVDITWEED